MTSDPRTDSIDHAIGPTGLLTVKLVSRDIRLVPSPDNHVRVRSVDNGPLAEDIKFEMGDGSLSIREEVGRFLGVDLSIGKGRSVGLEVEVPPAAETTIQTASSTMAATGLTGDQHYRSASGDIRLERVAGHITAETVSGEVAIGTETSVELIVKTVSGDVAVDADRIERVRLTTTSGDIRLISSLGAGPHAIETLSGDALIATNSGVRIQARTISGDLRSDLPHTSDGMMGRRSLTVGDGAVELSFRSVSGDLRVVDPATAHGRETAGPSAPTVTLPRPEPTAWVMPTAPIAPTRPAAQEPPARPSTASASDDRRLEILRALERGEIDIASASDELALLDESADA
jgi:hypothetical protein